MSFIIDSVSRRSALSGMLATAALPVWAQSIPPNPDVVVIGAGSAGLAAARTLIAQGKSVVVVEGAGRIGGRAYTESDTFGVPYDHGCSEILGPKNVAYVDMARKWNFNLQERGNAGEVLFVKGHRATGADRKGYDRSWGQIEAALAKAGREGLDVPASSVIPADLEFSGTCQTWMGPLDWGVDFTSLSTMDNWEYGDTPTYYMAEEGYGAIVARMGSGLPVKLDTPATRVDWSGTGVAVETPAGTIRAKACIVTVSTGVLAAGAIEFTPALPAWKSEAIGNLPMGLLAKVTMQFDGERFGLLSDQWLTYWVPNDMPAEVCYFFTWPFEKNIVIGFVGGAFGWELSGAGTDAAVDFALGELVKMVGSKARDHFVKGHLTSWAENPWTYGAYAAALPGHFSARADLAKPLGDRVFFAGEAVAVPYVALCSGAYASGESVARDVARIV